MEQKEMMGRPLCRKYRPSEMLYLFRIMQPLPLKTNIRVHHFSPISDKGYFIIVKNVQ